MSHSLTIPASYSPIRRMIISEYLRIREMHPERDCSIIIRVSLNLGYKINKNKTNSFVRKVIRDFIVEYANSMTLLS